MGPEASFGPGAEGAAPDESTGPRTALRQLKGQACHGEAHLARLMAGLEALAAPGGWLPSAWGEALAWAADQGPDLALRAAVQPGARRLRLRSEPIPDPPTSYSLLPMVHPYTDAAPSQRGRLPHKGCLGPWHAPLLERARGAGADDVLLHAPDGRILETAIAAVGLAVEGQFLLPPLDGRVRSLSEVLDLPGWADERGWQVVRVSMTLQDLSRGSLWCFNALRGIWPARVADDVPHP